MSKSCSYSLMILSTWVQTASSSGEAEDAVKQQFIRVNVWGKGKNFLSSAKQMLSCTRMLCRKYLPCTLYGFRNSVSYVMLICDQISVDGWNLIVTTYNIIVQHCWIRTTFPSRFKLNNNNFEGICLSIDNGHPTVHIHYEQIYERDQICVTILLTLRVINWF